MRYETDDDVKLRLQKSLVRYGGRPVIVDAVADKENVVVYDVKTGKRERCTVAELDLTPVPLGYSELEDTVVYVTRKPTRRYKQGLTTENIVATDVFTKRAVGLPIQAKPLARTVMGEFKSVEDAFQLCRNGERIVPFAREWAVANYKDELCVMYRGNVVGYVGDDNVMLSPDKYFLKESLMEALNV